MGKEEAYRGCLLGLAAGDALGYAVDSRTLDEIRGDYGPAGLLGYDLVNGYADVTSHTQIAAFVSNSLLVGLTRGQMQGKMAPYVRYVSLGLQEWSQGQQHQRSKDKTYCWVSAVPELRRRRSMDTRMVETLLRDRLGTPEEPANQYQTPGALCAAIPVGLFFSPERMEAHEVGRLGAEAVALTHGDPMTFLTGAALAYSIAGILQEDSPLEQQFTQAVQAVAGQFGREYPQAAALRALVDQAVAYARDYSLAQTEAMERLRCVTCGEIFAGAVYACLISGGDFDAAMIAAVNHSGRSAAVGAVTGALLGAKLGDEGIPEFYLECLALTGVLRELGNDLAKGCPMGRASRLFDDDWDQKYIQGLPLPSVDWYET